MPNVHGPSDDNAAGRVDYLVVPDRTKGADSEDLRVLLRALEQRADLVVRVQGSADHPVRLELSMSESAAAELRARFGSRLIIERDARLRY